MQLISDVLEHYRQTRNQLAGRAFNVGNTDQKSLLTGLPEFFENLLDELGRKKEFLVEGSIGIGNMPNVPWVGIFNRSVTLTAQEGYYLVLLFSEDMTSCYLSLNQGVTEIKEIYGRQIAQAKMRAAALQAIQFFHADPYATVGPINLQATGHLGKGYEQGAIESYRYEKNTLPSNFDVAENFYSLLGHYDRLVSIVGPSLQTFVPINETEFQCVALEKAGASLLAARNSYVEPQSPVPAPMRIANTINRYERNVDVAAFALKKADFKCEIDAMHETFVSRARNQPYVEAHHLVPMGEQGSYHCSLDIPANVISLCVNCHKLLHHGRALDKKESLSKLFLDRRMNLAKMNIFLEKRTLLSYYNSEFIDMD
jgi:5-methylcytosine-specific restriction enzyme A